MIKFCIFILFIIILTIISHAPIFKISNKQREEIREYGLVHFTNQNNYKSIITNGLKGRLADMGFPETLLGELVWLYKYEKEEDITSKHDLLMKKKTSIADPQRYNLCLKITGMSDEDIDELYTRCGFIRDNAIVFKGKVFNPNNIEILKRW